MEVGLDVVSGSGTGAGAKMDTDLILDMGVDVKVDIETIDVTGPMSLALVDSSSSASSNSSNSNSTSSSNSSVYTEGLEEVGLLRLHKTASELANTDQKLHRAEEERDGVQSQLKSKEQEFDLMMVKNSSLRPEVERLKKSLDDEKVIRGKLRSIAEVSRTHATKYKEAFEKAKSLAVGVVRVYKKSPAFKVLIGKQSLPSFQYGVETLKEYVDESMLGINYIETDFLKPVKTSEEPYDEDDQKIYCKLEQVFDGEVPPASPSMSEVDSHGGSPSTPPVGISPVTGLPITPGGCINLSPDRRASGSGSGLAGGH
ncbi:hypothetical protein NE237_004779 [Protea cynaroides]|uniref:Uncharacterized protein n=1 Tax=Protea cynaroides TaxID=273540 RepID=A0A9Q0QTN0_9MAGN|nr:hypothetical protein NE237_004779 [Protea cynaroides]